MDQSQVTSVDPQDEAQQRPSEEALQESVRLIEQLLEGADRQAAWVHFGNLHPADKGDMGRAVGGGVSHRDDDAPIGGEAGDVARAGQR